MDKDYFLNSSIPPPLLFERQPMPAWKSLFSSPVPNSSSEQSSDCFLIPNWDNNSTFHYRNFDSSLSSIASSPAASNPAVSNDSLAITDLIVKLDNIYNSGDISPQSNFLATTTAAANYIGSGNELTHVSCYSTSSNSPPKLNSPFVDHFLKQNLPNLGKSMATNSNLANISDDPGFAERAAKFSCFGSRSFNGRTTSHLGLDNTELPRVFSSPSLKEASSPMGAQENQNPIQIQMEMRPINVSDTNFSKDRSEFASSNEGSSVSDQFPNFGAGVKTPTDSDSRKRKAVSRGKSKEILLTQSANAAKAAEAEDDPNSKRCKSIKGNGSQKDNAKTEQEMTGTGNGEGNEIQKQAKAKSKLSDPPKDYIHVRARRGQATDSHSLAERVRREKIGERMKLLQDLVPGCNKVTGKALMLDEIINYVQSLQRQVEFLSMKLASVNPGLNFNVDSIFSKDVPHPVFPLDSSASPFFGHHTQEIPQTHTNPSNLAMSQCATDPLTLTDEFVQGLPQFPALCEDDLQSIVQMGFGQNSTRDTGFHSQSFPGSSDT
ncbi:hypothetical protein U1Q18_033767 [Sarracenia purpurea var. burkii]